MQKKNVKEKESKVGTHQRPHNTPDPRNTWAFTSSATAEQEQGSSRLSAH